MNAQQQNFFLLVPRNWGQIELQRYPEQTLTEAMPAATSGRFKGAAFCLLVSWLLIVYSLRHSISHYCAHNGAFGTLRSIPFRFQLILPLALVIPAYQALCAWEFAWSPLNVHGLNAAIYAGGYTPALLILIINAASGFMRPNEDRELLRQRHVRGEAIDREIGIVRKPAWWRRVKDGGSGQSESMRERIARNVRELGGGKPTANHLDSVISARAADVEANNNTGVQHEHTSARSPQDDFEMTTLHARRVEAQHSGLITPGDFAGARAIAAKYSGRSDMRRSEHTVQNAASLLFPGLQGATVSDRAKRQAELTADSDIPPPSYTDATADGARGRGRTPTSTTGSRPGTGGRSNSTGTTNSINGPPQKVKSMLDL
jgi:hypothetical protein